jgi:hypothetical protein
MAVTLPYPTYTPFTGDTVHSYTEHNTPHAGLLGNDLALKNAVDTLQSQVSSIQGAAPSTFYGISPPPLAYQQNWGTTWALPGLPSEWYFSGTSINHPGSAYTMVAYPGSISRIGVSSIQIQVVSIVSNVYLYVRLYAVNYSNRPVTAAIDSGGDSPLQANTTFIEMPYASDRRFYIRAFWTFGFTNPTYGLKVFFTGFRKES